MSESGEMEGLCVVECKRCPALVGARSQIVNGVGPDDADLVFLGEAPGKREDEGGEPFVGRSGEVLDEALGEAGLVREDVRITNCIRCRPPENRDPHKEELENCKGYLANELAQVDPDLVVTLGKVPSQHVLGEDVAVTKQAGEIHDARVGERSQRVLLSVHPAATLYDRSQRETFFDAIAKAADLAGPDGGSGGNGQSSLGDY